MKMKITEIADRIRAMREILDITPEEMSKITAVSIDEYLAHERGERDFSINFVYNCAVRFNVDFTELITGENSKLSCYSVTRKGQGLPVERRKGFNYLHLAPFFRSRSCEPFMVTVPASQDENEPIHLSSHTGQEMDYIINGTLKMNVDGHIEILNTGDVIYLDSSKPHGMIAVNGKDCKFIALVLK